MRATPKPDDYAGRPLGLALLALGSLLFYTETWLTIVAARAHHPIQYFGKGVYVQPLFVVLGLIYTVFGAHASRVLGPTRHPSRWGVALMVVLIACCFAYLFAVERYLRTLGYAV